METSKRVTSFFCLFLVLDIRGFNNKKAKFNLAKRLKTFFDNIFHFMLIFQNNNPPHFYPIFYSF